MGMYPAYRLPEVLDMFAITFFTLLNEGYRIKYANYYMLASIAGTPHMEDGTRKNFLQQLEWASTDPSDILKPSDGETNYDDLAKLL